MADCGCGGVALFVVIGDHWVTFFHQLIHNRAHYRSEIMLNIVRECKALYIHGYDLV